MSVHLQVVHEEHDDAHPSGVAWLVRLDIVRRDITGWPTVRVQGAGVSWLAAALDALDVAIERGDVAPPYLTIARRQVVAMAREREAAEQEQVSSDLDGRSDDAQARDR